MKQNFQLTYFYSDTENGLMTQVWCTLIAYLLLQVIQTKSESEKSFSTIAALLRMYLISHLDLTWVVKEGRRAYPRRTKSHNKSPTAAQLSLFRGGGQFIKMLNNKYNKLIISYLKKTKSADFEFSRSIVILLID